MITTFSIILGFTSAAITGVLFGFYPAAQRATARDPIEALCYGQGRGNNSPPSFLIVFPAKESSQLLCVLGQGVPQVFLRDRDCGMPQSALKPPQALGGVSLGEGVP